MQTLLDKIKAFYSQAKSLAKKWGKKALTLTAGTALAASGGAIADEQIDPYMELDTNTRAVQMESLEDAGQSRVTIRNDRPEATLEKWDGEVAMTVSSDIQATANRAVMSQKLRYEGQGNRSVIMQPTENGFKIDGEFKQKPADNTFTFNIDGAENLDFFYQAPLWQEEGLKGPTEDCTATDCEGAHRPEEIVGSYAVYHKTKKNHVQGETNYATGKAFHIPRPLVVDDAGNETWGELKYEKGELSVTVPSGFLDKAVYPVVVDPTFGYETIGGTLESNALAQNDSNFTAIYDNRSGTPFTAPEDGELDSVTAYIGGDEDVDARIIVNELNSESVGVHGQIAISSIKTVGASFSWKTFNLNGESIENGVDYIPNAMGDGTSLPGSGLDEYGMHYDSGSIDGYECSSSSCGFIEDPDNPWDWDSFEKKTWSIYATYSLPLIVTTSAVDNIGETSGDGNGETFNATSTERGFVYDTSSHATPTAQVTNLGTTTDSFESVSSGSTDLSSTNLWKQASVSTDDGDWEGNSGGTGSSGTGPSGAQDGSIYIYTEASSGNPCDSTGSPSNVCIVEADITDDVNGTVDYYYHMDGADQGTFSLDAYDGSSWTELWSVSGDQGTSWNNNSVSWSVSDGYTRLRFHKHDDATGFEADIALDNIVIHEESVSENSPANSDYTSVENETGTFSTGTFSLTLSGLSSDTQYYVRAYAENSEGFSYGSEVDFTTNADGGATTTPVQSIYTF